MKPPLRVNTPAAVLSRDLQFRLLRLLCACVRLHATATIGNSSSSSSSSSSQRRRRSNLTAAFLRSPSISPDPQFVRHNRAPNLRHLSSGLSASMSTPNPPKQDQDNSDNVIFAANQPADLPDRVARLRDTWHLTASRMGITRTFCFPSFDAAWSFMASIAEECKALNHHPTWSNTYNKVTVEWTTHRPKGLSKKDAKMAEFCDRIADEIGMKT